MWERERERAHVRTTHTLSLSLQHTCGLFFATTFTAIPIWNLVQRGLSSIFFCPKSNSSHIPIRRSHCFFSSSSEHNLISLNQLFVNQSDLTWHLQQSKSRLLVSLSSLNRPIQDITLQQQSGFAQTKQQKNYKIKFIGQGNKSASYSDNWKKQ